MALTTSSAPVPMPARVAQGIKRLPRIFAPLYWSVSTFVSAVNALTYRYTQIDSHVVIVDYLMPEMLGDEFLRRAYSELPPISHRFIVYAVRPREQTSPQMQRLLANYALPFITKPFGIAEMLTLIRSDQT